MSTPMDETLDTIADLRGAADVAEAAGLHDDALRYRVEAAAMLGDFGHSLLSRADEVRARAHAAHRVACERARAVS